MHRPSQVGIYYLFVYSIRGRQNGEYKDKTKISNMRISHALHETDDDARFFCVRKGVQNILKGTRETFVVRLYMHIIFRCFFPRRGE